MSFFSIRVDCFILNEFYRIERRIKRFHLAHSANQKLHFTEIGEKKFPGTKQKTKIYFFNEQRTDGKTDYIEIPKQKPQQQTTKTPNNIAMHILE